MYCPGNFFFPFLGGKFDPSSFWWSGYLPVFEFDRKGACSVEVTPYVLEPDPWRVTVLTGEQRQWYLDYLQKISAEMQENGDHWFDIWCADRYGTPLELFSNMEAEKFSKDPEDPEALLKLPRPRNMLTCQAHYEIARRVALLLERKVLKKLQKEIPALKELQTARFYGLKK